MMFRNGDLIEINDKKNGYEFFTGRVVGHNHITDQVAWKTETDLYKGVAIHLTKAKYCTLLERKEK